MFTLISSLGDPFGNHFERVYVPIKTAFWMFLPGVLWLICLLITFFTSLFSIWHMTGSKWFLLMALSFGLAYGVTSCFHKAYSFTVLVGHQAQHHRHLNGAIFLAAYAFVGLVPSSLLIYAVLRTNGEAISESGPPKSEEERRLGGGQDRHLGPSGEYGRDSGGALNV